MWSYRNFILNKAPVGLHCEAPPGSEAFVRSEISEILETHLPKDLANEACWVYLRGLLCTSAAEEEASQAKPVKRVWVHRVKDLLTPFIERELPQARERADKKQLKYLLEL